MTNLTEEQIDALYVNFLDKSVIHRDPDLEAVMKQELLINEVHKAQFVTNLEQPGFFELWGTIN